VIKFFVHMSIPFLSRKRQIRKEVSDYKEESLQKLGREQFRKLVEKGMELPVVLL